MCARLGMVGGRGLAGLLRERYGRWALWPACLLLVAANVVNIGADLGSMAASVSMLTGIPAYFFTPACAALMAALMAWSSYNRIAKAFKWMTLVLFAYVLCAFLAHPDWREVVRATFVPQLEWSRSYLTTFVALLGTSISPYLFFWQSAQQVEEERLHGRLTLAQRQGATEQEKRDSGIDVFTGMLFSDVMMYFIILTTGATLHLHGQTHIRTTQQAAEALRPVAGHASYLLFTLGIVGTGTLSVPVLAGSTAYAIAEGAGWRDSLKYPPRRAPQLYFVLTVALLLGLALSFVGFSVVEMLFWSAVVNGLLAPPLIVAVVVMSSDRAVMGRHVSSPLLRALGWLAAAVMTLAAVAMFRARG